MPNRAMMTQEDCQLIFKLRCRVTKIKTNLKGLFDTHECGACGQEEETQEHIIKCTKLRSMHTDNSEHPEHEKSLIHCVNCVLDRIRDAISLKETETLSMPCIASGINSFPKERCAELIIATCIEWLHKNGKDTKLKYIRLCDKDEKTVKHFRE